MDVNAKLLLSYKIPAGWNDFVISAGAKFPTVHGAVMIETKIVTTVMAGRIYRQVKKELDHGRRNKENQKTKQGEVWSVK